MHVVLLPLLLTLNTLTISFLLQGSSKWLQRIWQRVLIKLKPFLKQPTTALWSKITYSIGVKTLNSSESITKLYRIVLTGYSVQIQVEDCGLTLRLKNTQMCVCVFSKTHLYVRAFYDTGNNRRHWTDPASSFS